jgi:hypothetical protein
MRRVPRLVLALTAVGAAASTFAVAGGTSAADHRATLTTTLKDALASAPDAPKFPTRLEHAAVPEDRYAMAGGCYVVRAANGDYVTRTDGTFAATATEAAKAERFRFQAFDLGKYLLFAAKKDFLAAAGDPAPDGIHPVTDVVEGAVRGTYDESLQPAREPVLTATGAAADGVDAAITPVRDGIRGDGVEAAAAPTARAEWVVKQTEGGAFSFQLAVDDHEAANPGPLDPAISATLTAAKDGTLALADGHKRPDAASFRLRHAKGCSNWPEIEVNISGGFPHGRTAYGETHGFFDAHLHGMAFEFLGGKARCGRPWHPYGVAYALVDCPDHEPGGRGALLEDVVSNHTPGQGHDTVGWPTFGYWPRYDSLTHEQVYYKWLERAWRGGLRMYTNLLVDNGVLCEVYPYKKNSCNEMDTVRLEAKRLHEFIRYIDAQWGGPGEGWLKIVKDPFEARRVINEGKLAVIMGIEVSVPFDCGEYLGTAKCSADDIDKRMQEVYDLGVRQMELTNKFDNALTGVTGDGGSTGVVVNSGNRYETGHYWKMGSCPDTTPDEHKQRYDKQQYNLADESGGKLGRDAIFAAVLEVSGVSGAAPAYPAGPHCNVIGLSDLGRAALRAMMKRGMVFDPDHMSALARKQAMAYVTDLGYGGVVSSHSWADDPTYRSILDLGGVVTPHAGGSFGFVGEWRKLRAWRNPDFFYGIGWGSDVNGFSKQGAPRKPLEADDVDYPFTGFGGVTVRRQVSGERKYDVNVDGVDHYGLYPDWVKDGVELADGDGPSFYRDLTRGPEAYLQMWERAIGIKGDSCRSNIPDVTNRDLGRVRRGMTPEQVLATLGQPHRRIGTTFSYCATGGDKALVEFTRNGTVRNVAH